MGKNIKFFKKVTSLVLTGLTIFSSVPANAWKSKTEKIREPWGSKFFPAKAWKEEDPREAIKAEVRSKLQQGYKEITFKDSEKYNAITGYSTSGFMQMCKIVGSAFARPIDGLYGVFIDTFMGGGSKVDIDDKYFETICQTKNCDKENIVSLEFVDKITQGVIPIFRQINFPNLIEAELQLNSGHDSCFCGICFLADDSIGTTFSKCPDLKLLRVTGKSKIGFLNNDYFNTERKEHIDLFPSCKHSVLVVCETQEQADSFRKIMGKKGDRHKVLLKKDFEKFDEVHKQSVKYNVNDTTINKGNGENKNIIIPKHVKKIEAGAFKNSDVMSVTFEEGIHALELGDECFAGCPLVKFGLPKSLKYLKVGKDCFKGCPNSGYLNNYVNACKKATDEYQEELRKYNSNKKIHKEEAKEKRKTKEEAEKLEAERKAAKERIENKIKEVSESIEKIENNKDKKVVEANLITFKDKLNRLLSEKQEETNERIIALQKDYYTAECELAKSVLERFKVELDCKKDLLDVLKQNLKDLENTKEINSLWETMSNKEAEANSKLKEAQRLYDEAKRARDEADKILREANEKEQENNRIKKELEEQKEMQAREQQRLEEEKKKLEEEKNKGFFSGAWEKVSNFSPVKKIEEKFNECIVEPLKYYGHKALVGCKIALGVVAVVIAAKTIKPIVDLCTSIKKFFQTKSKKVVPQKPSNSTSATPV